MTQPLSTDPSQAPPAPVSILALGVGGAWGLVAFLLHQQSLAASCLACAGLAVLVLSAWQSVSAASARAAVLHGALALAVGVAPISWLGAGIIQNTHHRPLGAATFAVLAVGMLFGCVMLALRAGVLAARSGWLGSFRVGLLLLAALAVGFTALRAGPDAARWLADLTAGVLFCALAVRAAPSLPTSLRGPAALLSARVVLALALVGAVVLVRGITDSPGSDGVAVSLLRLIFAS